MNDRPAIEFIPPRRDRPAAAHMAGRGLHRAHFAFMRAVLEGLDPVTSWRRYLAAPDDRSDARVVRSALQWVRDEFAAAALRERRPGTARLVLLDPSKAAAPDAVIPSLEAFAANEGLDGFSQAEQLESYEARFGAAASRQRRVKRLLQRQLEALRWLETLSTRSPRLQDPLAAWLHPGVAARLSAAGLQTLGELVTRIQGHGVGWHRGIAAIGAGKAGRILRWLRMQEVSLGISLGLHTELPRARWSDAVRDQASPVGDGVRPLEKLVLPPALDGRAGTHRASSGQCQLNAADDVAAIHAWLGPAPGASPQTTDATPPRARHTYRTYRKEAERLLLWATVERQKPLSSLDEADAQAYLAFLGDPQPRERWCGPASAGRWSARWRPLTGGLSPASQQQSARVLRALFAFLVERGYLTKALFLPSALAVSASNREPSKGSHEKHSLTFLPATTPETAWRVALYDAAQAASWSVRQLCEARWCDVFPDPAAPQDWLVERPAAAGRARRRPPPPHLRLSGALVAGARALDGMAPCWAGPPLAPHWHLVPASAHAPPVKRRPRATPGAGIQPGTLRDQLRAQGRP